MSTLLTGTIREIVVALRTQVTVMASIVGLAGAGAIDRLAVITVCTILVTLARHAVRVTVVPVVTTVAVRCLILFATLALACFLRAVSGQVEIIAVASCAWKEKSRFSWIKIQTEEKIREYDRFQRKVVAHVDKHRLRSVACPGACRTSAGSGRN